jgi:hypothetical protein
MKIIGKDRQPTVDPTCPERRADPIIYSAATTRVGSTSAFSIIAQPRDRFDPVDTHSIEPDIARRDILKSRYHPQESGFPAARNRATRQTNFLTKSGNTILGRPGHETDSSTQLEAHSSFSDFLGRSRSVFARNRGLCFIRRSISCV